MHFSYLFLFKNHFLLIIIFWLLRSIWLPGVHCILVLFQFFFSKNFSTQIFLLAKNTYPKIFLSKNFVAQKVLIDWQNCCDEFNNPCPLYTCLDIVWFIAICRCFSIKKSVIWSIVIVLSVQFSSVSFVIVYQNQLY